jgi:hypothetical protein
VTIDSAESPWPGRIAEWIRVHGPKVQRGLPWVQIAVGLLLAALAWHMGHEQFALLRGGSHTSGRIVRFEQVTSSNAASRPYFALHPVVEFEAGGRRVQFRDRIGSQSSGGLNETVAVLFDAQQPSIAMIERPVWNWLPWAPIFLVGLLLLVAGGLRVARAR